MRGEAGPAARQRQLTARLGLVRVRLADDVGAGCEVDDPDVVVAEVADDLALLYDLAQDGDAVEPADALAEVQLVAASYARLERPAQRLAHGALEAPSGDAGAGVPRDRRLKGRHLGRSGRSRRGIGRDGEPSGDGPLRDAELRGPPHRGGTVDGRLLGLVRALAAQQERDGDRQSDRQHHAGDHRGGDLLAPREPRRVGGVVAPAVRAAVVDVALDVAACAARAKGRLDGRHHLRNYMCESRN